MEGMLKVPKSRVETDVKTVVGVADVQGAGGRKGASEDSRGSERDARGRG